LTPPNPPDMSLTGGESARSGTLRRHISRVYERGAITRSDGTEWSIHPVGLPQAEGEALRDLAVTVGARRTIETGMGPGMSTLFLCEALLASRDDTARHVAIDPLQQMLFENVGLESIRTAGVSALVEFIDEPADIALPMLLRERRGTYDLGLVDGDHHFDNAFIDCFYLYQLLKPGGTLAVDDVWMPAVDLVVRYLTTNLDCRLIAHPTEGKNRAGKLAVLETPASPTIRPWDSFVPFTQEGRRRGFRARRGGRSAG
jgi:predicted O-methyltransferase YrrM